MVAWRSTMRAELLQERHVRRRVTLVGTCGGICCSWGGLASQDRRLSK
jgi:hypothetical protein